LFSPRPGGGSNASHLLPEKLKGHILISEREVAKINWFYKGISFFMSKK